MTSTAKTKDFFFFFFCSKRQDSKLLRDSDLFTLIYCDFIFHLLSIKTMLHSKNTEANKHVLN